MVLIARRLPPAGELRVFAIGLVVAASVYIAFALLSGEWLGIEAGGVVLFAAIAWLGRRAAGWLALGWATHVAWDVWLHLDRAQPVVGAWYPMACVGFDLIVAGYLLSAALPRRAVPNE